MRHVPILLLVLGLPLAFVACGDDDTDDAVDPIAKTSPNAIQVPAWLEEAPPPPPDPTSQKEFVKLDLPSAMQARKIDPRQAIVVNALPDGSVMLKGNTYAFQGTDEERAAAVTAMRDEVAALLQGGAKPLLIHADRLVPWSVISTLLKETAQLEPAPSKIVIAAFRPPDGWEHAFGGTWRAAEKITAADRDAVPMTLAFQPGEEGPTFTMVVGRNNWRLGKVPESFDDAPFLKAMNRMWRKVADYLQTEVRGEKYATFQIPPNESGVWLAHAVTALDLLAAAGVEEVLFPVEGLRLRFEGR